MGREILFSLGWQSLYRDGVSIKILVWRHGKPNLQLLWVNYVKKLTTETNNVNGSRLAEQEPSSHKCSWQGNIGLHHVNDVISKRRKWTSQENKIARECYLLREPKLEYRKCMLSLWLQKGMFWVSEQRLVDQANTIRRNSWMTELEI